MAKILFFLGLSIVGVLSADWTPLDPEEVAYRQGICMENHFGDDFELVKHWIKWKLPEGDKKTTCYVKCLVEKLGIYDGGAKKFQPERVDQQYKAFKDYNGVLEPKANSIKEAVGKLDASGGDCDSIAKAFIPFNNKNMGDLRKIFLVDTYVRQLIYCANTQIKPKGISIFRFCAKKFYKDGEKAYCNVRRHGISDDPKFIQHSNCTTRGMRWMKKNGEMDESVILRDLHLVNVKDKDAKVKESLKNCKANDASKARDYYKCLYDGLGEPLFMKVLDYIEIRSENYNLRLRKATAKYDADAMRANVESLDADAQCPKNGRK